MVKRVAIDRLWGEMILASKGIQEFKNKHKGKDVYVLGSGGTLNFINPQFFNKKITVCVNDVGEVYLPSTQYIVTKYHDEGLRYARLLPKCKVVVSKGNRGSLGSSDLPEMENLFTFEHNMNRCEETNVFSGWPNQNPDALFVSWSSITSAMHFAAYLGAKNIIMVAHDCGTLGEKDWVKGYPYENWDQSEIEQAKQRNKLFENQSIAVKRKLKELYEVNIYSLNPFINYNLEGVQFRGENQIN
jgi:hypothetical protein